MIINTTPENLADHNLIGRVKEFTMKSNAKSYRIMSSKLYGDKIRAVIRELSTNAVDSHIEANNPEPFEVHLPTVLEPWFHVRDFGVGMDHETVESVYTTYFETTKGETNLLNGGLGLGSKSPFAYTDNFTIVAIKNGIKRVYSAFISDNGTPSVILMSETSTNERTGMCIIIPVQSVDFSTFATKAQGVYKFFDTVPIESNGTQFVKLAMGNEILPNFYSIGINGQFVRMANVAYPIDASYFSHDDQQTMRNMNFLIDVPNGSVEFQPSREGLEYTKETISVISGYLSQLRKQAFDHFNQELSTCKTPWEKWKKFQPFFSDAVYRKFAPIFVRNDADLKTGINDWGNYSDVYTCDIAKECGLSVDNLYRYGFGDGYNIASAEKFPIDAVKFVVQTGNVGIVSKVKRYMRSDEYAEDANTRICVISKIKGVTPDFDKFFKHIGGPPQSLIMTENDIPDVKPRAASTRTILKNVLVWNNIMDRFDNYNDPIDITTMMYIRHNGALIDEDFYGFYISDTKEMYKAINALFPTMKLITIRKKSVEHIPDGMKDALQEAIKFLDNQTDEWYDRLAYYPDTRYSAFSSMNHLVVSQTSPLFKYINQTHPFTYERVKPIITLKHSSRVKIPVFTNYRNKREQLEKTLERYPLYDCSFSKKKAVEDYIRLIDKEYP